MANVTGPTSSTDTAIARWDGTSGTVIQDSTVLVDGSGNMTGVASIDGNAATATALQTARTIAGVSFDGTANISLSLGNLSDVVEAGLSGSSIYLGPNSGTGSPGNSCTAVGASALQGGNNHDHNTAVGNFALNTANGEENTCIGSSAGTTAGNANVAVGFLAMRFGTGDYNVVVGPNTAATLTTGSDNILIGQFVDVPTASTSNYLNIGSVITGQMNTGAITLANGFMATTQSQGDNSTKLATTAYADAAVATGITVVTPAIAVQAATTANMSGYTYNNGSSGVGATLTQNTAAVVVIDGYTLLLDHRVLLKDQTTAANNGLYVVTTLGTASIPAVFTRALNYNQPGNINDSAAIPVINGTTNTLTSWLLTSHVNTVGTDALTYAEASINPTTILTKSLPSGDIFVGNGSNIATGVAMSGDVTINNSGVTAIKSSVALAGSPTTTTQSSGDNSTKIATTAYVDTAVAAGGTVTTTGSPASGNLSKFSGATSVTNGDLSGDVTTSGTLATTIKSSVALAGSPTTTTQAALDNSTKIATTAYVDAAVSAGGGGTVTSVAASGSQGITISGSPITSSGTITVGLGNITPTSVAATGTVTGSNLSGTNTGDQTITLTGDVTGSGTGSFATSIKSGVALAGNPTTTTQSPGDNTTKIATTAFVTAAVSAGGGGTVTTTGTPASGNLSKFSGSTSVTNGDLSGDVTTSGTLATTIKSSVALAGSPTTTTQTAGDNSTKIATTAFVATAVGASVVYNVISGFLPSSITGTHTTASLSLSAGQAADSTNVAYISKSSTISWAAANGNAINGTDAASSTLANSTTYHIFVCSGTSGTGSFVSASLTPTLPTGYNTYSRRVGSFNTDGSGAPLPYTAIEAEGGSVICWLGTQVLDINAANTNSSARTLYTLSTPNGIRTQWLYRLSFSDTGIGFLVTSGDETDVASARFTAFTAAPGCDGESGTANTTFTMPRESLVTTNTSAQVGIRVFSATGVTLYGVTRGWKDYRRS